METILHQSTATRPKIKLGPSPDHIAVWRQDMKLMSDEEIESALDIQRWNLERLTAEREDYPPHVLENSRLNSLAVIAAGEEEQAWRRRYGLRKQTSSLGWDRNFLDDLKAHVRIESEVGRVTDLKKTGSTYKGLCPFHEERTPSLVVWPDSGRWHCFGCGLHGDIFTWTQASGCMGFADSVTYLAAMAGIEVPKRTSNSSNGAVIRERARS